MYSYYIKFYIPFLQDILKTDYFILSPIIWHNCRLQEYVNIIIVIIILLIYCSSFSWYSAVEGVITVQVANETQAFVTVYVYALIGLFQLLFHFPFSLTVVLTNMFVRNV